MEKFFLYQFYKSTSFLSGQDKVGTPAYIIRGYGIFNGGGCISQRNRREKKDTTVLCSNVYFALTCIYFKENILLYFNSKNSFKYTLCYYIL
jgi:hypothetical protein